MRSKKVIEISLFVVGTSSIFQSGIVWTVSPWSAIILLVVGLFILIVTQFFMRKNIEGAGDEKITVSDKEPKNPREGDLRVDTK